MVSNDLLEDMCRAFADAPGRKAATGENEVTEISYDDLPDGSKDWYRSRMRAAVALLPEGTLGYLEYDQDVERSRR